MQNCGIHFTVQLYYTKIAVLGGDDRNPLNRKMNATPSFGVTMISEVPSNPQLTLAQRAIALEMRNSINI